MEKKSENFLLIKDLLKVSYKWNTTRGSSVYGRPSDALPASVDESPSEDFLKLENLEGASYEWKTFSGPTKDRPSSSSLQIEDVVHNFCG